MIQSPQRLGKDMTDLELSRALREAQGDVLSPEAVARVRAGLRAAGVLGAASASAAAAPAQSLAMKALAAAARRRVGVGVLAIVAVGAGGAIAMRHAPSRGLPDRAGAAGLAAPAAPPADPEQGEPQVRADPPPEPSAAPDVAERAEGSVAPIVRAHASSQRSSPSPREGLLLLEARRALDTDPARSLALIRLHEQEFPASQLAPERARISGEANRRLGTAEGRSLRPEK
jgi:hypothetical protein